MKTLKQLIIDATLPKGRYFLTRQEYINLVKEWLTQKQAEYLTQKDWELSIRQVFDELLEELNQ